MKSLQEETKSNNKEMLTDLQMDEQNINQIKPANKYITYS
jgi:hypothetical protein